MSVTIRGSRPTALSGSGDIASKWFLRIEATLFP